MSHRTDHSEPPTVSVAVAGIRRLGFWTSILVPFAYLPVLYGTDGTEQLFGLLALVLVNVLGLLAGHNYSRRQ